MEERTIIQSENIFANPKLKWVLIAVTLILAAAIVFTALSFRVIPEAIRENASKFYDEHTKGSWYNYSWDNPKNEEKYYSMRKSSYQMRDVTCYVFLGVTGLLLILYIVFLLLYLSGRKQQITVTDKRVYGVAAHKRRVDLPLDSISAISMRAFKGLAVATASGRINFIGIKNRDDVHKVIGDLLIERQSKPQAVVQEATPAAPQNVADEIERFKDLLDMGVISQDEFDAKKRQLLGL